MLGPIGRLRRHTEQAGQRDAIVTVDGSISYSDFLAKVEAGAGWLAVRGVGEGTVVGLTIADEVNHLTAALSLFAVGARQVTLASFDTPTVRETLARRLGVSVVVAENAGHVVSGLRLLLWPEGAAAGTVPPDSDLGTIFLRTSGTTGEPNITEFSLAQLDLQAEVHPDYRSERLLRLAPIEHNNSKRHRLYCLLRGGTNVFRPGLSVDLAEFCVAQRVTCLDASMMHVIGLCSTTPPGMLAGLKLRVGGAPLPGDIRRSILRTLRSDLQVRYGATECGAIAIAGAADHDDDDSVGSPLTGVVLEIVAADGRPLPAGEVGEIRLKAPGMATGYFDNPEATARRFRDGWFWPGDMGRMTEDGQLVVEGRKDDMMVLNGINVFPAEIERVLERHPLVAAAAAVSVRSPVHGDIPVAAVELTPGGTTSVAELQSYAREHLALRAPRRILILPALPRNAQGKVLRREIGAAFERGRNG